MLTFDNPAQMQRLVLHPNNQNPSRIRNLHDIL